MEARRPREGTNLRSRARRARPGPPRYAPPVAGRALRLPALRLPALRLLAAAAAAAVATAPSAAPDRRGTYRVHGTARLTTGSLLLDREVAVHADAVLRPGAGPRDVVARIRAEGGACDLEARVDDAGALAFRPGQRCVVDLASRDVRGRLDVALRRGEGRVGPERLDLALMLAVSGKVAVRAAPSGLLGPGETWTEIPVDGDVDARAGGRRDRSRAAEP
jgi:hypothetical protein